MGIVPLWGFQMVIAISISLLLRLNKTLVLIAANVSIPPMIPLVIYLSHVTGKFWMGRHATSISFSDDITLEFIHNNFIQYALGAVTLATLAGLFFGLFTYCILKVIKHMR
jgi:uncharacterized protein (DUF2062 family)